jgi:hypothetical protein
MAGFGSDHHDHVENDVTLSDWCSNLSIHINGHKYQFHQVFWWTIYYDIRTMCDVAFWSVMEWLGNSALATAVLFMPLWSSVSYSFFNA